jgi:hypothetical protein
LSCIFILTRGTRKVFRRKLRVNPVSCLPEKNSFLCCCFLLSLVHSNPCGGIYKRIFSCDAFLLRTLKLLKSWIVKLDPETGFFKQSIGKLSTSERRQRSPRHTGTADFFCYIYLKLKVSVHNFDIFDNSQRFASLVK